VPEDYIHRVGRTGRAELTGEAFTFVAPEEEDGLRAIERVIGRALVRVTIPNFDYLGSVPKLEVPRGQRIAAIRAQRAVQQQRRRTKTETGSDVLGARRGTGRGSIRATPTAHAASRRFRSRRRGR